MPTYRGLQIALVSAALALIGLVSGVRAEEAIAVDNANPPFMFEQKGTAAGIYPALVTEIFKRIETPVTISSLPWKRALMNLDNGLSGVAGIYKNEERLKKYSYTDMLFSEEVQIFVEKGQAFPYTSIDSLKGKTIGVIAGWSYGDAFDGARSAGVLKVEEAPSDALNFKKLVNGRLDVVLAIREAAAVAEAGMRDQMEALPQSFSVNPSYIAFSNKTDKAALIARINETLGAMHKDGTFDGIVKSTLAP
jgi:polar amino acid transport system substrate-binding protein